VLAILLLMLPHIALWLLHKPLRRPLLLISAIVIAWSIFWAAIMLFELEKIKKPTALTRRPTLNKHERLHKVFHLVRRCQGKDTFYSMPGF